MARRDDRALTYRPGDLALLAAQRATWLGANLLLNTRAELVPGGGYFTRILSRVVGPQGKVYTLQPVFPGRPDPLAAIKADPSYSNVQPLTATMGAFAAPEPLDDPPGVRLRSSGLRVSFVAPHANAVVTVLPTTIAPPARSACTHAASARGCQPA